MKTSLLQLISKYRFHLITSVVILIIISMINYFPENKNNQDIEMKYDISLNEDYYFNHENGKYSVENPHENFKIDIEKKSFSLKPTTNQNWFAKYDIASVKVNRKKLKIFNSPEIKSEGNLVSEKHGNNFQIDYKNDENGLRQDFIIFDGPKNNVKFEVKLNLTTNLLVKQKDRYSIQLFDPHNDINKIDYKDLIVYDDSGQFLRSEMKFKRVNDKYEVNLIAYGDNVKYPVTIDPLSTSSWDHESSVDSTYTGFAVTGGCDVNGDGYDDVVIGSYGYDKDTLQDVGKIEAFYGSASGLNLSPAPPNFAAIGSQTSQLGYSVDCAGDINNDGFDDIIVGAPIFSIIDSTTTPHDTIKGVGAFYIFYGSASGLDIMNVDTFYGTQENMFLGLVVAGVGDVNNDNYDDILVSAPKFDSIQTSPSADTIKDIGIVYLYLGSSGGLSSAFNQYYLGTQKEELFGTALSGAGNVNGDPFDDILIGAYNYTDTLNQDTAIGIVHMYFGKPTGTSDTANWVEQGMRQQDHFGYSLSSLGDIDGDGDADIIIGANKFNDSEEDTLVNSFGSGAVFIYRGLKNNNIHGIEADPYTKIVGDVGNSGFGSSVSGVGDVDGDNIPDFIVGAPNYTYGYESEGAVYGFYGANTNSGVDSTYDWLVTGESNNAFLGISVSSAGHLNSDALDDVIVGAYGYGPEDKYRGAAFAYYGKLNCGLIQYGKPVFLSIPFDSTTVMSDPGICG
ncbi:MAG TPA: hypothetical protein ENI82_02005, partial [Bacteroidetes bacterium]|nr:hypothetical protein [Bacteroidota bacterium]